MTDSGPFIDSAVCRIEDGAQSPGMRQEEALQLVVIFNPE
jgi:hypothetical protein